MEEKQEGERVSTGYAHLKSSDPERWHGGSPWLVVYA